MRRDGIVMVGLMPHAPILVEGVGGERAADAVRTTRAMAELSRRIVAVSPDVVVVLSPHSPAHDDAVGVWRSSPMVVSCRAFGAMAGPFGVRVDAPLADAFARAAAARHVPTWHIYPRAVDYGAAVPLYAVVGAGWCGPALVLGIPEASASEQDAIGGALREAAVAANRAVAVIASGDLSHRLTPTSPAGFHPLGGRFDAVLVETLAGGAADLHGIDPALSREAAEDATVTLGIALAAASGRTEGREILSYEAPFGVGYGVAVLFDDAQAARGTRSAGLSTGEAPWHG